MLAVGAALAVDDSVWAVPLGVPALGHDPASLSGGMLKFGGAFGGRFSPLVL